jgi:BMFP domain-containing protein YqiC
MIDNKIFDEFTKKMSDAMPPAFKSMQVDFEKNIKSMLASTFNKLDLVTREEFEVQLKVLEKTRARLEALEEKIKKTSSK